MFALTLLMAFTPWIPPNDDFNKRVTAAFVEGYSKLIKKIKFITS